MNDPNFMTKVNDIDDQCGEDNFTGRRQLA